MPKPVDETGLFGTFILCLYAQNMRNSLACITAYLRKQTSDNFTLRNHLKIQISLMGIFSSDEWTRRAHAAEIIGHGVETGNSKNACE